MGLEFGSAARLSAVAAAVLVLLSLAPSAAGLGLVQDMCNGSTTANGIIAQAPIVGLGTTGVTSVAGLAVVIMLTVFLVMVALYMIAQVIKQPGLENFMKVELAEMFGTCVIIAIFFGSFFAASFAVTNAAVPAGTNPTVHFNGPGRSVFVGDCMMIGNASIALIPPIFGSGVINFGLNLVDSVTIKVVPGGFGFIFSPLQGLDLIQRTLTELSGILSGFFAVLLALNFLLGLIYSLFPIFLYLGIVFRAFPWTRAAGGIFIAMFIGFYVVFPLMINATVGGVSTASYQQTYVGYYQSASASGEANVLTLDTTANSIGLIGQQAAAQGNSIGTFNYLTGVLGLLAGFHGQGVINGFITDFMGPPIMIIIEIVFSFIVALDFADVLSDLLGAPSLSTQSLLGKLV